MALEVDDQEVTLEYGQLSWPDGDVQPCRCYMHGLESISDALTLTNVCRKGEK